MHGENLKSSLNVFKKFLHRLLFWTILVYMNPSCTTLRYRQIVRLNAKPARDIYEPSQSCMLHINHNAACSPVLIFIIGEEFYLQA